MKAPSHRSVPRRYRGAVAFLLRLPMMPTLLRERGFVRAHVYDSVKREWFSRWVPAGSPHARQLARARKAQHCG
jgi:hypothetical protein